MLAGDATLVEELSDEDQRLLGAVKQGERLSMDPNAAPSAQLCANPTPQVYCPTSSDRSFRICAQIGEKRKMPYGRMVSPFWRVQQTVVTVYYERAELDGARSRVAQQHQL